MAQIDEKSFLNDWQKAYLHFGMATIYLQMNWEVPIMDYVLKNMAAAVRLDPDSKLYAQSYNDYPG